MAMYISPDRYDAQFTIMGLASDMRNPTRMSVSLWTRARYFCGTSDVGICFAYQDDRQRLTVWVDGDCSGNAETCKSTMSRATKIGEHTVET